MSLIHKLREETAKPHQQLEELLFSHNNFSIENYIFFLQSNYQFHNSYEPAVYRTYFTELEEWDRFDRKKTAKIKSDLEALNVQTLSTTTDYFNQWPDLKLLGAAYVSEGSTLGGKVILKRLQKESFFEKKENTNFVSGYGKDTGQAWKNFMVILEREGQLDENIVINGAVEAFEFFKDIVIKSKR